LRGVTEAFLAAYTSLAPSFQHAARLLAQGASVPIPEVLLDSLGPPVSLAITRVALITRSWVTPIAGPVAMFGVMHALIADFLRAQAENASTAKSEAMQFVDGLVKVMISHPATDTGNWPIRAAIASHAAAVLTRVSQLDPTLIRLRAGIADWMGVSGNYAGARDMFASLAQEVASVMDPCSAEAIQVRGSLGRWLGYAGDRAGAVELFARLLQDQLQCPEPDQVLIRITRGNLTNWLIEVGDFRKASELANQQLAEMTLVCRPDDEHLLTQRALVADCTGRLGDFDGARRQLEELLADRIRYLPRGDRRILITRNNLAYWMARGGGVDEAIGMLEPLLKELERVLGPEHPDTAGTRNLLREMRQGRPQ
jgi:tetratricopeptide (TPR) repeat protein